MEHFNSKYLQSIDAKGRLQLSRDIRGEFRLKKGDALYLLPSTGPQPHLEIRTSQQWKSFKEAFLAQTPSGSKRDFMRFVELSKEQVATDGQGRIGIPQRLRELCSLDGQVMIINMTFCVEIWNPSFITSRYQDFAQAFKDFNDSLL